MSPLRSSLLSLLFVAVAADKLVPVSTPNKMVKVSGANFRADFKGVSASGPFNKPDPFEDCGGYVWASTGNFEDAILGLEGSISHSFGQKEVELHDKDATAVWFHILPNGTHPWHIHENMDEFVTVMSGYGFFGLVDPEKQSVTWYPCYPGTVMTMPRGFMHMYRAGPEGLQLLAFADVQQANLALIPTYMSTLPHALKETVLGKHAAQTNSEAWEWGGSPGSGPAFLCPENSDDVTAYLDKALATGKLSRCNYTVKSASGAPGSCAMDVDFEQLLTARDNGVGFGVLDAAHADCVADGAWCTVDDQTGQTYGKMELQPKQMLQAIVPSGYMLGYVTQGSIWVEFYHPNNAYHLQFEAHETDLFYIPMDLYFSIININSTHPAILNVGIRGTKQLQLKGGSSYIRNRLLPLSVPLRSFRFPLAGAAFFSNGSVPPHSSISAEEQRAAYEASPALSSSVDESNPILTGDMAVPLVYTMSDGAFALLQQNLSQWEDTDILCTDTNMNCGIEQPVEAFLGGAGAPMKCSPYGASIDPRCAAAASAAMDPSLDDQAAGPGANSNQGGGGGGGLSTSQVLWIGAICVAVSGAVGAAAGFAAFKYSEKHKQQHWSAQEGLKTSLLDQQGQYHAAASVELPEPAPTVL